ncbi:MAG: gamma-glutamyltransferase [Pseudomonadota bacterium]
MAKGAVAAGHRLTADAALTILRDGGNAVDAAIAALWMACVCEPVLASPGGGGFAMVGQAGRPDKDRLLDFFVETPHFRDPSDLDIQDVSVDFGTATQDFRVGAGTSAVPGMGPGLFQLHQDLGSIPMPRLAEPAIYAAREGVRVTDYQEQLFKIIAPIFTATESVRAIYAPDGDLVVSGDTVKNVDLADALDWIARDGVRSMTEGDIAEAILASQGQKGLLDRDALARYAPQWRTPTMSKVGHADASLNPTPSAGGTLISAMLSAKAGNAKARAETIDAVDKAWNAAGRSVGEYIRNAHRGTTHVSIVDSEGLAVAITVSNGEGNGMIVPGCGFMLNNMMGEDDVNPGGFEPWTEGQRLSSMMAPTIVHEANGAIAALGSGGSNRIRTAMYQVLARRYAGGMAIEEAIEAPRMHIEGGHLDFEDFFREDDRDWLAEHFEDHRIWPERSMFYGGVHAVERDPKGGFRGAGDPRRDGVYLQA